MRKLFFFIASIMLCGTLIEAQTIDYYTGKTEVKGLNYVYKVSEKPGYNCSHIYLKNINNTKIGVRQYWPDGEIVNPLSLMGRARFLDKIKYILHVERFLMPKKLLHLNLLKVLFLVFNTQSMQTEMFMKLIFIFETIQYF